MGNLSQLRAAIQNLQYADEDDCVNTLLKSSMLSEKDRLSILERARDWVVLAREKKQQRHALDAFIEEFGLSNKEGVALMCLAESLLRIPDRQTSDKLIAEKLHHGNWDKHLGQSNSLFVNASTWGLALSGKLISLDKVITNSPNRWYQNLVDRMGEPVIRLAMYQAMRLMGDHYVLGSDIKKAMSQAGNGRESLRYSFDMLGEGARTMSSADDYFDAYLNAITKIGKANQEEDPISANGISIKLSALHPRYEATQSERVFEELLPRLVELVVTAKKYNIGVNIDAEECYRLELSLDLFESIARHPEISGWPGLGFVLQAYQKRAPAIADWLIALARELQTQFMVRLVKGAYWDSEVKYCQQLGLKDFPVYTRKANTDLSYEICANKLLQASDVIYPQFATHNAHTLALLLHCAKGKSFEFQRLHGMGTTLYDLLLEEGDTTPLRIYAPVGEHKDLLPYLVRRLLENGANSSFVHHFMDEDMAVEELVVDPRAEIEQHKGHRHPLIALSQNLFQFDEVPRVNSLGHDLKDLPFSESLIKSMSYFSQTTYTAIAELEEEGENPSAPIMSPSDQSLAIGHVCASTPSQIEHALQTVKNYEDEWNFESGRKRAEILDKIANEIEQRAPELLYLLTHEAGRTLSDSLDEIREACDFCRYYAELGRQHFSTAKNLASPTGESNELSLLGRGTFLCISPWNFPLAIFVGQISAALMAGNCVIAKPAEQTPLIASAAVWIMHDAGIPKSALQLLPGDGQNVGQTLVDDVRIDGVVFTGSTATAKKINSSLALRDGPIVPFIAETGGQNAMIVDSTALPEQVTDDLISSAFLSAGQRCSATRVVFLQEEIADTIISMLSGAMNELTIGRSWELQSDIGPIIDKAALERLQSHVNKMSEDAKILYAYPEDRLPANGLFFSPHIIEIKQLSQLEQEVFGPILHVIRYRSEELDEVINQINSTGYGLTLGIHSRIESRTDYIARKVKVGNCYINRNMVGAVVGVNPFGGQGLSGTGPKAGGPHYLFRFATEKTKTTNKVATGGNTDLLSL